MALDGTTAPLLLMQAVLNGLSGLDERVNQDLHQVQARWGATPAGRLAKSWQGERHRPTSRAVHDSEVLPFPSAIRPVLCLRPAESWDERAQPNRV
jgi:hypothetical protein